MPAPVETEPAEPGVLGRVDRFRRRHPGFRVSPPYVTASGMAEVTGPGDAEPRTYDTTADAIADLEKRYPVQVRP